MRAMAAALLLVACGSGGGLEANGSASENQIERLSTPKELKPDLSATARLQPIAPEELDREGLLGAGCAFSTEAGMFLVAANGTGAVRIEGRLRRLAPSAPVDGTGGFFRDGEIAVSVGRTSDVAAALDEGSSWPGRASVTNRRTGAQQQLRGVWTCGA
jgi:hypothetical protein